MADENGHRPGALRGVTPRVLMLLVILKLSMVLLGCQQLLGPTGGIQGGVTVDEILTDSQRFLGQTVMVDAEVRQVISEQIISLQSQVVDQGLLAILPDQALANVDTITEGDSLTLTGTVHPMTIEQIQQIEQQLGVDLNDELLTSLAKEAPFLLVQDASK